MTGLREDPRRAVIVGAGRGGSAMLEMLLEEDLVDVVGMVDVNQDTTGIHMAREHHIPVFDNVAEALEKSAPCVCFNMTGNEMVEAVAAEIVGAGGVIGGMEAKLIWRMVTNLKTAHEELRIQASHDALTGLYNRRYGMEQLKNGLAQALRYQQPYSVIMLDIDHFKSVNDNYGHAVGDMVLNKISRVLKENLRDSDISCRWGGEEFLVLLPQTTIDGAVAAAENWLHQIGDRPLKLNHGDEIQVAFSAGVATLMGNDNSGNMDALVEDILHRADQLMYEAKACGRCRVKAEFIGCVNA